MDREQGLKLKLELIWWGITFLIVFAVLFPIRNYFSAYPFLFVNILGIILFVTFTRLIFQFKHSPIGKMQAVKLVLILLCFPLTLYFIESINSFQTLLDENGIDALLGEKYFPEKNKLGSYVRTQFIFFAVGTVIATLIFAVRLIFSVWRYRNTGTI